MSSFSGLNLGARAVFAAQRGLDITGQNIANSATPGYSRQRVDQVAVGGPTVPAIWAKYDQTGGGVKVTGISRMRDEFLEARARGAHQTSAQLDETAKAYEAVERTVAEPSDTGLKQRMANFWQSWATAGNDLRSDAPRNVVVERGKAVADELNRQAGALETQWNDTNTEFKANITDVNQAAADVAKLNRAIKNNVVNGLPANELADQRDLLVEKLTTLTGGVAERDEDGVVNVKVGDTYLVQGRVHRDIAPVPATMDAATFQTAGSQPAIAVQWGQLRDLGAAVADTVPPVAGSPTDIGSGTLNAEMTTMNKTLPSFMNQLDRIAATIADTVAQGQLNGVTTTGAKGDPLFTDGGTSNAALGTATAPTPRAARMIQFTGTAGQLALSDTDTVGGTAYNGNNAKNMAAHMNDQGGADDQLRTMVVQLGVAASSVYNNQKAAANVAKTADDARESVSGVSLNEEMTNLMQYQHSFEAAAKFITAVDATIESLLNMTH